MKTIIWSIPLIFLFLAVFTYPIATYARKIKTSHPIRNIKPNAIGIDNLHTDSIISAESDSILFFKKIQPKIRFYGFDKTVGSSIESFFISNNLDSDVERMEVSITYYDMKGRQLHKRATGIDCIIPAGETMRTDIKSWDTQKSFYFYQSVMPKRQSTPFDVKIELLSVTLVSK